MAGEIELLPERILTRRVGHDASGLAGAEKTDRLDLRAVSLSASFRDDGSGNLGWYVGAAGALDGAQLKVGGVNRTSGVVSFPLGLSQQTFWSDGLVNPTTVTTDASRGTIHLRNSFIGATVAGDVIHGISFSGAGSSARRRALIASIQDTASLPPTAIGFFVNGSTVVGQDSVAERMRVSSNGNVGIGTSAPIAKLDVFQTAAVSGAAGTARELRFYTNALMRWSLHASNQPELGADAGSNLNISRRDDAGNFLAIALAISRANGAGSFGGTWQPSVDNSYTLGAASFRWSTVYAGTGTINTSDAREKSPVRPFAAAEIAAARDLLAEIGIFQWLASIEEKGEDEARLHVGMTVQRAIEIMEGHGLDPWRYGFLCRDEITRKVKALQTQSVQATEDVEEAYTEIEIRDGVPVRVEKLRIVQRPLESLIAVVDEGGQPITRTSQNEDGSFAVEPVMHAVPVMEEREVEVEVEEPAGDRLGFRYDQLTLFIIAGMR